MVSWKYQQCHRMVVVVDLVVLFCCIGVLLWLEPGRFWCGYSNVVTRAVNRLSERNHLSNRKEMLTNRIESTDWFERPRVRSGSHLLYKRRVKSEYTKTVLIRPMKFLSNWNYIPGVNILGKRTQWRSRIWKQASTRQPLTCNLWMRRPATERFLVVVYDNQGSSIRPGQGIVGWA